MRMCGFQTFSYNVILVSHSGSHNCGRISIFINRLLVFFSTEIICTRVFIELFKSSRLSLNLR